MEVEVELFERKAQSKGEAKKLRREEKIPVVVYSKGKDGQSAAITKESIDTVLRNLETGYLPTTIFILKDAKGKKRKAIVKDIQYKVTTYDVLHIDFLELTDDHPVEIKVPLECLGTMECVGVKAGGYLRQLSRHIKVRCLPRYIPSHFEIDVRDLDIRDVKKVSDIQFPKQILPLAPLNEVIATIAK